MYAEQFLEADLPWPAGVDDCGAIPGPHLHMALSILPMVDGDWVLTDIRSGAVSRVSEATFAADYEIATGPSH
jgi:hypothetical protein